MMYEEGVLSVPFEAVWEILEKKERQIQTN